MRNFVLFLLMAFAINAAAMTKGGDDYQDQQQQQVVIEEQTVIEERNDETGDNTAIWVALITTIGGIATALILNRKKKD